MQKVLGTTGLVLDEPLLWEKGRPGRRGFSLPLRDVEASPLEESLTSSGPKFPDLSEVDVVRHFTRLSTWNFGVDTGTYPLGSCTMKYNPKSMTSKPLCKDSALPILFCPKSFLRVFSGSCSNWSACWQKSQAWMPYLSSPRPAPRGN